jgi:hypothetical protein
LAVGLSLYPAIYFLYAPFLCETTHWHINRFRRASSVVRSSQGGEQRTAVWASHPEEHGSDGGVSPHVCDPMVVPARGVVLAQCNPSGSAVDAGLDATACALPAARAANSGVLYVQHALHVSPWTPLSNAQRVAQFGIVSKPVQKPVGKLTLFQGISQVLSHRKTT